MTLPFQAAKWLSKVYDDYYRIDIRLVTAVEKSVWITCEQAETCSLAVSPRLDSSRCSASVALWAFDVARPDLNDR